MTPTFLGLDSNAWLAIVGGVYAGATLWLALVTNKASIRAAATAEKIANGQNASAMTALERQIASAAESVAAQIRASAEQQERQTESTREAAVIQARAASVSNNRQAWINSLRDEVTGFLSEAQMDPRMGGVTEPHISDAAYLPDRTLRALRAHIFKIQLLINPNEGESTTLIARLEDALQRGLTTARREAIVTHTQRILKQEWERVKSGE